MTDDSSSPRRSLGLLPKLKNFFTRQASKEDLKDYLQEAQNNNIIDSEEAHMLAGILAFSEKKVRDVMIPRQQIISVKHDLSFAETLACLLESGHSRFPVEKDEAIIGMLLAKDLLGVINAQDVAMQNDFSISKIMRAIRFIPESKPLDVLLKEFRHQRIHMAVITNEYGEVAGLITIEDVLECIVGDIDDEYDEDEESQIKQLDSSSYWVDALTEVADFNQHFDIQLTDEQADTIGGHLMQHLGYVPENGERIHFAGFDFIVKEADQRRIISLILKKAT